MGRAGKVEEPPLCGGNMKGVRDSLHGGLFPDRTVPVSVMKEDLVFLFLFFSYG